MHVKIVSDGTSENTFVTNAKTGEHLPFVKSIIWKMEAGNTDARVELDIKNVEIETVELQIAGLTQPVAYPGDGGGNIQLIKIDGVDVSKEVCFIGPHWIEEGQIAACAYIDRMIAEQEQKGA